MSLRLFTLIAAVVTASVALAQAVPRRIPTDAPQGRITVRTASLVEIDGKEFRLAPGARFLTPKNATVTPNRVEAGAQVSYQLDERGQIQTVWILAKDPDRASAPRVPGVKP